MAVFQMPWLEFLLRKNSDSENPHGGGFSERVGLKPYKPDIPAGLRYVPL
jgi:hypothetical protein